MAVCLEGSKILRIFQIICNKGNNKMMTVFQILILIRVQIKAVRKVLVSINLKQAKFFNVYVIIS